MFRKREVGQSTIPKTTSPLFRGKQNKEDILQFIGPAQTEFKSFLEFVRYSLDNYWHNWRNYASPRCYVIPPIFEFKHPDKSDQDIQSDKPGASFHREPIDRSSDDGEHQIFKMIYDMAQIDSLAPFLAVRNLNIGGESRIRAYMNQIFSNIAKDSRSSDIATIKASIDCITEFDYVLIGPKIGIVVIEVKSSSFTASKYFSHQNRHLPDQIPHGIKQLKSFDTFLNLMVSTTGIEKPNASQIKKILFLPNLEKSRFDSWFENLDSEARNNVGHILDSAGINFWFQNICKIVGLDASVPENTYEIYGSIIAGIASMSILKNTVNMDELKLSERRSVEKVSQRISRQDPLGKLEPHTGAKRHNLEFSTTVVEHFSKSIILTPYQQRILNGPDRQFIIGAAGTGKTVILQEKALRLVSQGESVMVLVAKSYLDKFQKLLDDSVSIVEKRFKVEEWGSTLNFRVHRVGSRSLPITCKNMRELQETDKDKFQEQFGWILNHDHILIDDVFDSCDYTDTLIEVLAIARIREPPVKTFWVAFDYHNLYQYHSPCSTLFCPEHHLPYHDEAYFVGNIIRSIALPKDPAHDCEWLNSNKHTSIHKSLKKFGDFDNTGYYYSASILSRVMRYPENIFEVINETEDTYACFRPTPGHKIQGCHRSWTRTYENVRKAMIAISKRILYEIENLQRDKVDMKDVAVVTNAVADDINRLADCFSNIELKRYISDYLQQPKIVKSLGESLNELQIIGWNEVSSLEWPIVIYAECVPTERFFDNRVKRRLPLDLVYSLFTRMRDREEEEESPLRNGRHGRYRARTRTTGKLIEVVASFHKNH